MIDALTPRRRPGPRGSLVAALTTGAVLAGSFLGVAGPGTAQAVSDDDWLGIVNTYRQMSGLAPVAANPAWNDGVVNHSCYMLQNGITHEESPGAPGYTSSGDLAGRNSNIAVSSSVSATARNHLDLWMTGPFHAIGILRHNLSSSAFGLCSNASTPSWHSAGTLDVLRGIDAGRARPATPIVFPGRNATVPLTRFITEFPNPMTYCGWTGGAGLPLIAMMPGVVSSASATLTGPSGPISTCVLHRANTDGTAQSILAGENAVVVMPREELADGTYTATVNSNGGNVSWSFNVDHDAPLAPTPIPDIPIVDTEPTSDPARFQAVSPFREVDSRTGLGTVRLRAGKITKVQVAESDVVAISANFVAVRPDDHGFITAYNCTTELPTVSTLGYGPSQVIANQAIVPLQRGALCLYSLKSTDIVIDVNGFYRTSGGSGFQPITPSRLHDSRKAGSTRLRGGQERAIQVTGVDGGAPFGAVSVALNVTVARPSDHGYLQVYPCGSPTAAETSSINYTPNDLRPNSVVTPLDEKGRICVRSLRDTDVIVDMTGYFVRSGGLDFVPLDPIRLFDSRSRQTAINATTNGTRVAAGNVLRIKIAGRRGVPASAKAVSVNLTATNPLSASFLTAFPCGTLPATSNLNVQPGQTVANGAMVKLSSKGELCVYAFRDVHVIIDINGAWV